MLIIRETRSEPCLLLHASDCRSTSLPKFGRCAKSNSLSLFASNPQSVFHFASVEPETGRNECNGPEAAGQRPAQADLQYTPSTACSSHVMRRTCAASSPGKSAGSASSNQTATIDEQSASGLSGT